ncbi:MAG TPA: enoyl-CoA hydratase/isomerase family protein [Candidatus Corynebacterium gallistercoris]|uniref:3-hydroxyisobutyryl-CoA hydrolase n=1 Tax=Candidatus Corynebacterium gallistercoris TaxID=2838530 RepID=A0A9D1RX39_9CORY|nr:enoyl-CoA hydratase/isomerase family protein [Candidatus Corynebacterium gallistercoris]
MTEHTGFPSFIDRAEPLDVGTDLVAAGRIGCTGVVELRRPKALNSLNDPMIRAVDVVLDSWGDGTTVDRILLMSSAPRAFCAGGDVRWVRDEDAQGNYQIGDDFFELEYSLNNRLAEVNVPVIALLEGVVMGGGFGISAHGSHRVVTPNTLGAMPEGAIGFVPDVGMSHKLTHLPVDQRVGLFVAVTGWRLSPADMMFTGLGTHYVDDAGAFAAALVDSDAGLDEVLQLHSTADAAAQSEPHLGVQPWGESELEKHQDLILELCTGEDWAEMEAKIRVAASLAASSRSLHAEFIEKVVDSIDAANPESLVATVELFRRSQSTDLTQALELEWKVGAALRRRNNFIEGVRSVLIDKDRKPQFVPATVAGVNVGKWRDLLRG